jgi:hypothetical protein
MANFLVDASLPRPTAALLVSYGHAATDVRDIGMHAALDQQIAAYAQINQLSLLTKDQDFGNVLDYPPDQYHGIVVIEPPAHAGRAWSSPSSSSFSARRTLLISSPAAWPLSNPAAYACGRLLDRNV